MNKMEMEVQRVRNAKILILVGMFCINIQAQIKFNGSYCKDYDLKNMSNCLTFETKKNFAYEYSGDTGVFEFGHGEYLFKDNKLILNYNKTEPIKTGHHFSEIWTNNKDSIHIQFNVFDFDSLPLPAVSVIYKDSLAQYGFNGVASNKKGIAAIKLKKNSNTLQVEISNVGFQSYKFSLDRNYNQVISVFLQKDGYGLPIRNQIDTLQIEKIKRKYFTVRNKNGSITTWRKRED